MGNLMACTRTTQPINTTNGQNKNIGIENNTKRTGTSIQGIVENKMELAEAENNSLSPHRRRLHCEPTVDCPRMKLKNYWNVQLIKL